MTADLLEHGLPLDIWRSSQSNGVRCSGRLCHGPESVTGASLCFDTEDPVSVPYWNTASARGCAWAACINFDQAAGRLCRSPCPGCFARAGRRNEGRMKTKAAVCYAAGRPLEVVEVDLQGPKAGEVLVEIKASGVCHTDEFTRSGADPEGLFPVIFGHEGAGVVVDVGPGVTTLKKGDH